MTLHRLVYCIAIHRANDAAGQCLHFAQLRGLRKHQTVKAKKITRIVEGVDLPTAILLSGREARNAFKQDGEVLRQACATGDGLPAVHPVPPLHQLPECVEVISCRDAQGMEALNYGAHDSHHTMLLYCSLKIISCFPHTILGESVARAQPMLYWYIPLLPGPARSIFRVRITIVCRAHTAGRPLLLVDQADQGRLIGEYFRRS